MLRTMSVVDVRRLAAVDVTGSILLTAHDPALVVDHERPPDLSIGVTSFVHARSQ